MSIIPSTFSPHESWEDKSAGLSEVQVLTAIEKSREQGWSELADRGQAAAAAGRSHGQDTRATWEELKRSNHVLRDVSEDVLKLVH
jgi:hypothetical protein